MNGSGRAKAIDVVHTQPFGSVNQNCWLRLGQAELFLRFSESIGPNLSQQFRFTEPNGSECIVNIWTHDMQAMNYASFYVSCRRF